MEKIGVGLYAIPKGWVGGGPPRSLLVPRHCWGHLAHVIWHSLERDTRGGSPAKMRGAGWPRDRRHGYALDIFIVPIACSRVWQSRTRYIPIPSRRMHAVTASWSTELITGWFAGKGSRDRKSRGGVDLVHNKTV